jgi:hypothetical protein
MSFSSEVSKLFTNKYFLYFIVFLAVSNVLGYLVTNKLNTVIFFALIAFLASNFSKNMAVILLIAIVATNLLMVNKSMREGLENATNTLPNVDEESNKLDSIDPELSKGLKTLESSNSTEDAKQKLNSIDTEAGVNSTNNADTIDYAIDPNNRDLNNITDTSNIEGLKSRKSGFHNPKGSSSLKNAASLDGSESRIDYATTLEDAYDNLDKINIDDLFAVNRVEDESNDLWTVFNRIQENLTHDISNMNEDIRLNQQLFSLVESFA